MNQRNFIARRMLEWFDGDGKKSLDVSILKSPEMEKYLRNRLEASFLAGVDAKEKEPNPNRVIRNQNDKPRENGS